MAFTKKVLPSKAKPGLKPGTKQPFNPGFQKKFKGKGIK